MFSSALAGIASLALMLPADQLAHPSKDMFYTLQDDYPLQTHFAAAGAILLGALMIWSLVYRPPKEIYRRFHQLDSNVLDTDTNLGREFYQCALEYRVKNGSHKFNRHFIEHYNFFYEFHNYALSWIDNLLTSLPGNRVPHDFILAAICSGQIGQVFTNTHYASGLPVTGLKANDPLLFHARTNYIEVWSYDLPRPLCKVRKRTIKLQNAHRHSNHLTALFTGIDQSGQHRNQLEIRFLGLDSKSKQSSQDVARDRFTTFKQWLKDVAKTNITSADDYGIDVSELLTPGRVYDTPLTRRLGRLDGKQIQAFYTRATLPVSDKNIPLDAVVLCKGMGIITINEKPESGDISYSGDPLWYQYIGDDIREIKNPCQQAKLARSALSNLLSAHNLCRWPIISLVVYSSSDVTLNMGIGQQRLQCHVIKLENLEKWFANNVQNDTIHFTDDDLMLFRSILNGQSVAEPSLQYATI